MSEPEQARASSTVATDVELAGGPETDTPVASDPIVRIRGLTYTYARSDEPAVRDIDFTVHEGEIFGFLGPSGAGKSTTQKVLTGLLDGYEGSVRVFGEEVANHGGDYYERIGISAEAPNHYLKLTGRENLTLFASLYDREPRDPDELLELVGLADNGDRPVSAYSKGMRMRLNFARALLNHPDLLVLDEPTNGLDPGNAKTVKDVVRDLRAAGTTVFVTTHDMSVADQLCDRVAFMVDGEPPRRRLTEGTEGPTREADGPRRSESGWEPNRFARATDLPARRARGGPRVPASARLGHRRDSPHRGGDARGRVPRRHRGDASMSVGSVTTDGVSATLDRLASMLEWDVRLQVRYGFYAVYAVVTVLYVLGLTQVPDEYESLALTLVVFSDPAFLGFYFIAALVLFEKREGVVDAFTVSPLSGVEYLLSKTLSLTLLAVTASLVVALLSGRPRLQPTRPRARRRSHIRPLRAVRLRRRRPLRHHQRLLHDLSRLPRADGPSALDFLGVVESPLFSLLPTQASLVLIGAAFSPVPTGELVYGVGYLTVWIGASAVAARWAFDTYIVHGGTTGTPRRRSRAARRSVLGTVSAQWRRSPSLT